MNYIVPSFFALLQRFNVRNWTDSYDSRRVNASLRPVVVCFDVLKVRGRLEGFVIPVQLFHPPVNVRIPSPNGPYVTLEVTYVHGIKSNYGDK